MKLSLLSNDAVEEGIGKHLSHTSSLLSVMPRQKRIHSHRVAKSLHRAGVGHEGIYIGLLHDYLERGGDLETLQRHLDELNLPPRIAHVVQALTGQEKSIPDPDYSPDNAALAHLYHSLPGLDQDTKNIAVLAKMADRLDNLKKRLRRNGKIHPTYIQKSIHLIRFLGSHYDGPPPWFSKLSKKIANILQTPFAYG
jgi:hypothetical protein